MQVVDMAEQIKGYNDGNLSPEQRIMIDSILPDYSGIAARLISQIHPLSTAHVREGSIVSDAEAMDQWLDGRLIASHKEDEESRALWAFDGSWAVVQTREGRVHFTVVASVMECADMQLAGLIAAAPERSIDEDEISMEFCFAKGANIAQVPRPIAAPKWENIEKNYSEQARPALTRLISTTPEQITTGRLIVLHGDPGTGKTTMIRSLARAWNPWCRSMYVVDPDEMFARASYLIEIALGDGNYFYDDDEKEKAKKWRLLIVEDAEEFLVPDSKERTGQALARLLNLGDGLIGAGLRVLILLTTNAPLGALHQAVTRPGRCLANIEVPKMTAKEASEWSGGTLNKEATLAELYEATGRKRITSEIAPEVHGTYL